jgi:hypothetical protein
MDADADEDEDEDEEEEEEEGETDCDKVIRRGITCISFTTPSQRTTTVNIRAHAQHIRRRKLQTFGKQ